MLIVVVSFSFRPIILGKAYWKGDFMDEQREYMQELLLDRQYLQLYQEVPFLFQDMLGIESQADFEDFLEESEYEIDEGVFWLFYAAFYGNSLLIGGYEGDVTEKAGAYLQQRLPAGLLEGIMKKLAGVVVDLDGEDDLEKRIDSCNKLLVESGYKLQLKFDDTYCAGVYFLSVSPPQ